MTPFLSRSTVALWLLTIKTASAVYCSQLTCGVTGTYRNYYGSIAVLQSPETLTPEGCHAACLEYSNCVSFALGSNFCEPGSGSTAEYGFVADPSSYYAAYDLGCFDCLPDVVSSTVLAFSTSEEPTSTLMMVDSTGAFNSPQTSSEDIKASIRPESTTQHPELPTSTVDYVPQISTLASVESPTKEIENTSTADSSGTDTVAETSTEFSTRKRPVTSTIDEPTSTPPTESGDVDVQVPAKASSTRNGNVAVGGTRSTATENSSPTNVPGAASSSGPGVTESIPTTPVQYSSNAVSKLQGFLVLGAITAITFVFFQ